MNPGGINMKETSTILVVDGESRDRELLDAYLAGQGHELIFAGDGGKTAEVAPDLILLGASVPKMLQASLRLRANPTFAGTPMLLLVENGDRDTRLLGLESGVDDFVSRPLDVVELRARVNAMIRLGRYRRRVQELEERNGERELRLSLDATLESWGRALELRGVESEGHTERVTAMAAELAHAMGMSDAETVHVRRGAMVHDIGKMGIPDRIMFKVGPLDEDEWEEMRKHPAYAYDLLSPIELLKPALDVPYYHHEKWDGTGYPEGLKGNQIPLAARIFAVVDVWDALHSDRSYRRAWNRNEIGDYIREKAGEDFDHEIVRVFFDLLR